MFENDIISMTHPHWCVNLKYVEDNAGVRKTSTYVDSRGYRHTGTYTGLRLDQTKRILRQIIRDACEEDLHKVDCWMETTMNERLIIMWKELRSK